MIDEHFKELAKKLMDCYEEAYNLYQVEVERIITYKIKDISIIENTLDRVLDIYTEKGFYLFLKLLIYYRTVNIDYAEKYLEILKEIRKEEYEDFAKKMK